MTRNQKNKWSGWVRGLFLIAILAVGCSGEKGKGEISSGNTKEFPIDTAQLTVPDLEFAYHTKDNDISLEQEVNGEKTPLPQAVESRLLKVLVKTYLRLGGGVQESQFKLSDLYLRSFKIDSDTSISAFVALIQYPVKGKKDFYLFGWDDRQAKVTGPKAVDGRWMDPEHDSLGGLVVSKPYVSFTDLNKDGKDELLVKRKDHVGRFTGEEWKYYSLFPELEEYFSFYSRVMDPKDPQKVFRADVSGTKDELQFTTRRYDMRSDALLRTLGIRKYTLNKGPKPDLYRTKLVDSTYHPAYLLPYLDGRGFYGRDDVE